MSREAGASSIYMPLLPELEIMLWRVRSINMSLLTELSNRLTRVKNAGLDPSQEIPTVEPLYLFSGAWTFLSAAMNFAKPGQELARAGVRKLLRTGMSALRAKRVQSTRLFSLVPLRRPSQQLSLDFRELLA